MAAESDRGRDRRRSKHARLPPRAHLLASRRRPSLAHLHLPHTTPFCVLGLGGGLHHDHPRDEFARSFSHPGGEVLPHELIQWRATLGTSEAKLSRTGCGGTAAPSRSKQPWQCNLQHDTRAHTGTLRHTADRSELAAQTWLVRCRYFVLSNRKLSYYENETMSRLLGTVELEVRCTLPVLKTLLR